MRCLSPRTVGYQSDGKTLSWSQKEFSKEFPTFQLPCTKCVECRLEYGRQWAVRAVHEAQIHDNNCFITLTYDDDHVGSNKLNYDHFKTFMKDLRSTLDYAGIEHEIGFMAVGEYGAETKRQHWHACLFGWDPTLVPKKYPQPTFKYTTQLGDKVYESQFLQEIWGNGNTEYGSVTFQSAGYVARYSAKKLVHGNDQDHDFQPIFRTSRKNAIGKRFLEKFWPDIFNYGHVILKDGSKSTIPRYYEKWFEKNHPQEFIKYVTEIKFQKMADAAENAPPLYDPTRLESPKGLGISRLEVKKTITEAKFKKLQENQKL